MSSEQLAIFTEVIGVLGSVGVAVSYLFSNQRKLRIINLVACIIFVVYGILLAYVSGWINGWATLLLNSVSTIVHIVWLIRNRKKSEPESKEE